MCVHSCLCVYVSKRVRMRARVRTCLNVCVRTCVCVCVRSGRHRREPFSSLPSVAGRLPVWDAVDRIAAANSQARRAITQMLGGNITAVRGQRRSISQMGWGTGSSCPSPCCPTIWKQSWSPFLGPGIGSLQGPLTVKWNCFIG